MTRDEFLKPLLRGCVGVLGIMFTCAGICKAQVAAFDWSEHQSLNLPEIALDAKPMTRAFPPARAAAEPQGPGRFDWSDRRWGVEAAVTFIRFQSSIYYASLVGFKTSLSYNLNGWVEAEGGVSTGFAPKIYQNEHVKYLDYMVGARFGPHRETLSPWAHVLVGGVHLQPQTADNSKSAFGMRAGIGADYRLTSVASVRAELDWLRTQFFNGTQHNFQAATGLVFHF